MIGEDGENLEDEDKVEEDVEMESAEEDKETTNSHDQGKMKFIHVDSRHIAAGTETFRSGWRHLALKMQTHSIMIMQGRIGCSRIYLFNSERSQWTKTNITKSNQTCLYSVCIMEKYWSLSYYIVLPVHDDVVKD